MTMPRNDVETASATAARPETDQSNPPGARAQIRDVKNQVVDQAKTSLRQARDSAASSLNDSRSRAAHSIGAVASAVRDTGDRLRAENQGTVANLTETLADQVERLSLYLRDRDLREVREDLEAFARRQPAVAIGIGLAIGLMGARFIKSSQRTRGADDRFTERGDYDIGTLGTGPAGGYGVGSQPAGGTYGGA